MRFNSLRRNMVVTLLPFALLAHDANAGANISQINEGRRLAHDFDKGNCLACHAAPSDPEAITRANIAPPLVAMRARFGDREALRSQIWDAAQNNPDTIMPPFGRHLILTGDEIELIIDYLYTL
ncbi:MAG TPA: sulfur oxidation c-type cytochrome SoxX [Burkholderiales bacterium]|nr:sulfur oxidation c-type cytochrome SoxX [Burkholderiales bacterium]